MIELVEIKDQSVYQAKWQTADLHILQSWGWGEVKLLENWQILRLGILRNGILDSVVSMQWRQVAGSMIKFAYLPKLSQPNLIGPDVLTALKHYLKEHNFVFALLEFAEGVDVINLEQTNALLTQYPGHIQPQQTNLLRLARSEDDMFMAMDGKYRRNIKKAIREAVTVEVYQYSAGNDNTIPLSQFYAVLKEVMQNTKFLGRDANYFQTIWDKLGSVGNARIFLAKWQAKIVGAYLVANDNVGAYELYGGVTLEGRQVEAGYLLKWQAIRYYNNLGLKTYDHWGVAPKLADGSYDSTDELYQISKFKEGFGGEFVTFPAGQSLIISPIKYQVFLLAGKLQLAKVKLSKLFK